MGRTYGDCSKCGALREYPQSHSWCVDCRREYDRIRFQNDKERINGVKREYRKTQVTNYQKYKSDAGCLICGENDAVCLDAHHLDPSEKDFNLADKVGVWSWGSIQKELDKCVVLCSNCHRKFHAGRFELP
jgi:transcription elongation factor Elf1